MLFNYKKIVRKKDIKKAGFSFLEVLVALSIIAIVFTSIIRLQGQTIFMSENIKFYNLAPLLAQEKLADIENQYSFFLEGEGSFGEEFPNYKWNINIDEGFLCNIDEDINFKLKKIDISIAYNRHKYTITTYKFLPEQ